MCCSAEINGKRIRDRYVSSVKRERERERDMPWQMQIERGNERDIAPTNF